MKNKEQLQQAADAAMKELDNLVGMFAAKEIDRNDFENGIKVITLAFRGMSDAEITAYMDVELSGAYSDSESIYVYYEITRNTDDEEIVGTPSRVRLSRHAEGR